MPVLRTADDEVLVSAVLPCSGPDDGVWVVLAHGFSGSLQRPSVRRAALALSRAATVLAYDARGHGRSTGRTTLGDLEVLDVDAAVGAARAAGARRVVALGFSMGGAAVLRHAALRGGQVGGRGLEHPPDAVVSVSATSTWEGETAAVRRLQRLVLTRSGRAVTRVALRTRVAPGWDAATPSPLEVVGRVAPLPLLLVHGSADHYFGPEHAHALHAAARPPVELWLEPGMGHAEDAAGPDLLDRLTAHLPALLERSAAP